MVSWQLSLRKAGFSLVRLYM